MLRHDEVIRLKLEVDGADLEKKMVGAQRRANSRNADEGKRETAKSSAGSTGGGSARPRSLTNDPVVGEAVSLFRMLGRLAGNGSMLSIHGMHDISRAVSMAQRFSGRAGSSGGGTDSMASSLADKFRLSSFLNTFARTARTVPASKVAEGEPKRSPGSRPAQPEVNNMAARSLSQVARMTGRLVQTIDRTGGPGADAITEARWRGTSLSSILGPLGEDHTKPNRAADPGIVNPSNLRGFAKAAVQAAEPNMLLEKLLSRTGASRFIPNIPGGLLNSVMGGVGSGAGGAGGAGAVASAGASGTPPPIPAGGGVGALGGAAIALAVFMELKNIHSSLRKVVGGVQLASRTLLTGDTSNLMKGHITAVSGALQFAGGPIMGPLLAKMAMAGTKIIDTLDAVSDSFARYAPKSAMAAAQLQMAQQQYRLSMATTTEGLSSGWLNLKTASLRLFQGFTTLLKPLADLGGGILDRFATGIDWITKLLGFARPGTNFAKWFGEMGAQAAKAPPGVRPPPGNQPPRPNGNPLLPPNNPPAGPQARGSGSGYNPIVTGRADADFLLPPGSAGQGPTSPGTTQEVHPFFPWGKMSRGVRGRWVRGGVDSPDRVPGMTLGLPQRVLKRDWGWSGPKSAKSLRQAAMDQAAGIYTDWDGGLNIPSVQPPGRDPEDEYKFHPAEGGPGIFGSGMKVKMPKAHVNADGDTVFGPQSRVIVVPSKDPYIPAVEPAIPHLTMQQNIHQKIENQRTLHEAVATVERIMLSGLDTAANEAALDTNMLASYAAYGSPSARS